MELVRGWAGVVVPWNAIGMRKRSSETAQRQPYPASVRTRGGAWLASTIKPDSWSWQARDQGKIIFLEIYLRNCVRGWLHCPLPVVAAVCIREAKVPDLRNSIAELRKYVVLDQHKKSRFREETVPGCSPHNFPVTWMHCDELWKSINF